MPEKTSAPRKSQLPLAIPAGGKSARTQAAAALREWERKQLILPGWQIHHDPQKDCWWVTFHSTAVEKPYVMSMAEFRLYHQGAADRAVAVMLRPPFGNGEHQGTRRHGRRG